MADTFGLLPLPATAPATGEAAGDPLLSVLGAILKLVLNADLDAVWQGVTDGGAYPVASVLLTDPRKTAFSERDTPALCVFRAGGQPIDDLAADYGREASTVGVLWLWPASTQAKQQLRAPLVSAFHKAIGRALLKGRHTAYVAAGDAADADAIKTSIATSTGSASYSGAALNGAKGGTPATARAVTVTTTAATAAYNITDPIVFTGTDLDGDAWTESLYLTATNGGETIEGVWSLGSVTSVVVPAQLLATGAFTFGYAAAPASELGSPIIDALGANRVRISRAAQLTEVTIQIASGERGSMPRVHLGAELELAVEEILALDATAYDDLDDAADGIGLDLATTIADTGAIQGQVYEA